MSFNLDKNIYNIMIFIFLFSLPVSEAIKQISLIIFMIVGIYIAIKENKNFEFDLINISLFLFAVFTVIGAIVNGSPLRNTLDLLRCTLFFFILRTVGIEKINLKYLIYALFSGFLTSFIMGCISKFGSLEPNYLFELKSIGHVNHSAIFMILIFIVAISLLTQKDRTLRYFSLFISVVSLVGIFIASSRVTMYLLPFIAIFTLGYFWFTKQMKIKTISKILILFIFTTIISIYLIPDERLHSQIVKGIVSNETRFPIFYSSIYTWIDNPIFGIGSGMFNTINITDYFPDNSETRVSHAHNTFLTFLTEKGLIALLSYLAFQLGLFLKFIKNIKLNNFIFLAFLVLGYQNIISLANTTFHHENSMLMLFIWGVGLCLIKQENEKNHLLKS